MHSKLKLNRLVICYFIKRVIVIKIIAIVIIYVMFYGAEQNKRILLDTLKYKNTKEYVLHTVEIRSMEEQLKEKTKTDTKYILQWYQGKSSPFYLIGRDSSVFFKYNCPYTNCIMTNDPDYLSNITTFDAILFHGCNINDHAINLPPKRSTRQKYVFTATESSHYYAINNPIYDNFFNWTWTYKLDSEVYWGYITIYDLNGTVIGPKLEMHWPELDPVDMEIKHNLVNKSKAAAWFVSNCYSKSHREVEVSKINEELSKYGWSVDVYGKCGKLKCPRNSNYCYELIRKTYYFYFSFENSFAEDYVTEKLLTALNNFAVPVVFGTANYTRFLPAGTYLNAREMGPQELAKTMDEIIKNKTRYYDFFRWRNHFVYKETIDTVDSCNICTALNDEDKFSKYSLYKNFRNWWNEYD